MGVAYGRPALNVPGQASPGLYSLANANSPPDSVLRAHAYRLCPGEQDNVRHHIHSGADAAVGTEPEIQIVIQQHQT